MLTENTYREITDEFIGDNDESLYSYKKGSDLVFFFNEYFNRGDEYSRGFPSRWYYVAENLKQLSKENKLESFFDIVLSSKFLRVSEGCTRENLILERQNRIKKFNQFLDKEDYYLILENDKIKIKRDEEQDEYELIDSGGFAEIYRVNNNIVKKKLKEEFKDKESIKHRFRREYKLMEKYGECYSNIIPVNDFDVFEYSYKMKYCEYNLYDYIRKNDFDINRKTEIVLDILEIISELHEENILHRDLNPYNILIHQDVIYISDFGISKDLDKVYTHQTKYTKSFGNFAYTAPEQLDNLTNATKKSDVYSLGKIINFIFNKSPKNSDHVLKATTILACLDNPSYRPDDAKIFLQEIQKTIALNDDKNLKARMLEKIYKQEFDSELNNFFLSLGSKELIDVIATTSNSENAFVTLLNEQPSISYKLLRKINEEISTEYPYTSYDKFSFIAEKILKNELFLFEIDSQIEAAELLHYVATTINRFNAQDKIEIIILNGIEPIIEKILKEGRVN